MKRVSLAAIIVLSLAVSCNSDDSSNKSNVPAEATEQPANGTDIKDDVSQKDVVQVALGSKDHTTLVAALKQAELVEVLKKSGPFTVFAPTNAAFDKLPREQLKT
jgi:uncharacterized surface protein with fasciclin (FAS1) repeats